MARVEDDIAEGFYWARLRDGSMTVVEVYSIVVCGGDLCVRFLGSDHDCDLSELEEYGITIVDRIPAFWFGG